MPTQPTLLQEVTEFLKILIPLLIGFALGRWEKWRDKRKNIENIRMILNWEINYNSYFLSRLANTQIKYLKDLVSASVVIKGLETIIYDRYLDRINLLSKEEVKHIMFAYNSLTHLQDTMKEGDRRINRAFENKETGIPYDEKFARSFAKLLSGQISSTCKAFNQVALLMAGSGGDISIEAIEEILKEIKEEEKKD